MSTPRVRSVVLPRTGPLHRRFLERVGPGLRPERGLYRGEPEACRRRLRDFLAIALHLGLIVAVFHVFRLEGRGFLITCQVALAALPLHYALPYRWKQPVLIAATLAGLSVTFGAATAAAIGLLATLLVGLCYVPVAWAARVGMVAAFAIVAALARSGVLALGLPELVWPVLASFCMFRMIVFLYEIKHAQRPERLVDALSYIFLLPNTCFPHFPVVDYRTMRRGYFAEDIHRIQRMGLRMMVRGTTHLLLYRLIDQRLRLSPEQVTGPLTLVAFLVFNYLLYLRVSGQFHMACGMLHLFGYKLPETHHHYLLATGFTDYWRRINIYWKDFMVRVVFHPIVFRLREWPRKRALALATLVVFTLTWLLHGYQSFWLRGRWTLTLPDIFFWGILGALVLVNIQRDATRVRPCPRLCRGGSPDVAALALRLVKILGTFVTLSLLWALWSSPSVLAFLALLRRGLP
jgi:D-alanyl-lipoteichoic acid acyltransferase DltB (MBOAT superfamily)